MYSPLQTITIGDGQRLVYRVQGQGPDVILIHGWASSGRMWQSLSDALAADFRCWSIDLPGFGDSPMLPGTEPSISKYVTAIGEFAQALELGSQRVIGHSLGGMVSLAYAVAHDADVEQLILINPVVTGRIFLDLRLIAASPVSRPLLELGRWVWPLVTSDWLHWARPVLGSTGRGSFRRIREDWAKVTLDSAIGSARAISHCNMTSDLPRLQTPTLVILGSRDLTAPNSEGRAAARLLPNARMAILNAGHLPTDDVPQQLHGLVDAFLQGPRPAPAEMDNGSATQAALR